MKIIVLIYKFFLSRRYKVEIKNVEVLKHNWPVLLLPNHVALVDPQILITFLYKYLKLSPVASELFFNVPVLKQIMKVFWTIPVWEMTKWADSEKVKEVFWKVVDAIKDWKNILIYPSGQVYRQGFESIIWKQSVYNICQNIPENTKIIWLRDRWLWGSMWSKSWDDGQSWFFLLFIKWVYITFINLIFFIPKRKVSLELEDITEQINLYKNMSLLEFNKYLENFYNKYWEEKINYIKHYWFYNNVKNRKEPDIITWSLKELNNIKNHNLDNIDDNIKNKIIEKISLIKEIDKKNILEDSKLIVDLFFDSLDLSEIKSFVAGNFEKASNPPIWDLKTVWDLIIMAVGQSDNVEELKKCEWQRCEKKVDLVEKIQKIL